ncbi:MAG: tetraacyldisaccharide 4'-kinase [Planctomycetes bacterium]|nr:tetraacyldisaccharide 4'-kinase [Planctomycetota bacterium]
MLSPSTFRDLVSGRRRGLSAALTRGILAACEVPYSLAVRARNASYDLRISKTHRVNVPVVSVGNLTMGGTGKTPMVAWLARWFGDHDVKVAIVSRGYGARDRSQNDEALELAQKLPGVPHLQNPDRVSAARQAINEQDCGLVLLDDAYQHRRIHRDLDIVLIDAFEPFGFEHVFPRGTLREPRSALARADVVALSRADALTPDQRKAIRNRVRKLAPDADWFEVVHRPTNLISGTGEESAIDTLSGQRVAAFCAIGNPAGFRHTILECGLDVADFREFPDHHPFVQEDVVELADWAKRLDNVAAILCTHKDLVKINRPLIGRHPLRALGIELEVCIGKSELEAKLQRLIPEMNR